mmetsp:Transcript_56980/g.121058  ORF Transcript_56980/g.121058 Transcript_56980/m.121058 type:complete len:334 (-) Transcript_56980:347-1348(-)
MANSAVDCSRAEALAHGGDGGSCQSDFPDLVWLLAARFFDSAQPVGRLASSCRALHKDFLSSTGKLLVVAISTNGLQSFSHSLQKACPEHLRSLRLDLSKRGCCRYTRPDIDSAFSDLRRFLASARILKCLVLRLSSFDSQMERLRLGTTGWKDLTCGLRYLVQFRRLRELELSYVPIKHSHVMRLVNFEGQEEAVTTCSLQLASHAGASSGCSIRIAEQTGDGTATSSTSSAWPAALTPRRCLRRVATSPEDTCFVDVLCQLRDLEDLRLTHAEMVSDVAKVLPTTLAGMRRLKSLDLTRNHISKQAMEEIRQSLPSRVVVEGDDQQTFYFH